MNEQIVKDTDFIRSKKADIDSYYKVVNGVRLPIKIYKSGNTDKADILILTIHGGAWHAVKENSNSWDGSWMNYQAQYYADKGYTTAAISYRDIEFDETTTVFDLIQDCKDALAYLKDKICYNKLIIMGDSAGGHLATELGLDEDIKAELVVAANPVLDLADRWHRTVKNKEDIVKASPIYNIKPVSTKFFIMHGTEDVVVDINISKEFCSKMKKIGNDCEFYEVKNAKHAFILSRYISSDAEICTYMKVIDGYLKNKIV